jgi:hypothetical protein
MSVAVRDERFILTATDLSDTIVGTYSLVSKRGEAVTSGGNF